MAKRERPTRNAELAHTVLFSLMIGGGLLLMSANLLGAGDSAGLALLGGAVMAAGLFLSHRQL